ncbi:hypothetical protein XELAEV_18037560mg [Xenopus laevis]|uniref:Uncharacterized protein n=1 Tax=Xenopus laevis TaxID=8355 RepID=A0A974HAA2_XENLA|nr:hypothetical protein XELAEV_18037560mg [Xenopus laevis]
MQRFHLSLLHFALFPNEAHSLSFRLSSLTFINYYNIRKLFYTTMVVYTINGLAVDLIKELKYSEAFKGQLKQETDKNLVAKLDQLLLFYSQSM